jgi:type VI secretion system secreted protein Hcp
MAVNIHVKIDSIDGMSMVSGFEKQIQAESYSWGMTQTTNFAASGGGGAGKVNMGDLTFEHVVDAASPKLILACCQGTHLASAVLTCSKVGSDGVNFFTITLTDVLVSSVKSQGENTGDTPTESVSLAFAQYKVEYQAQDNKGAKQGGAITAAFNVQTNKKV